jgi:O-antigen/teichoic acid export membrane protein
MLAAQVAKTLSKGLLVLLLTKVFLSPEEYGLLFLAISILTVALLFSNLGFAKSGARYLAEYRETDESQVPFILTTTLRYVLLSTVVVGVTLVLASGSIADILGEPSLVPLLVAGVGYVAMSTLATFLQMSFQGFNRVEWSAAIGAVSSVVLIVSAVGLLLLGFGIMGVMYAYVAGSASAVALGSVVLYRRFYARHERGDPEPGLSGRILRYSVPLTAARGANRLDKQVDTILVGFILTPVAVGFYVLGKQISEFLITPATSLGFSVSPSYGEQKAQKALEEAAGTYERTFTLIVTLFVSAAIGLALVADPAIPLVFSAEYAGAVPVVQVFGLYVLLRAVDKITNDGLDYLGRATARAKIKIGTSIGNFLLNLVMIPTLGVVGAAIATVLTYSILVGAELYIIRVELGVSLGRLFWRLSQATAVGLAMAVVVLLLLPYVSGVPSLFGVVLAGMAVWAALVDFSGLVDLRNAAAQVI